MQRTNLYLFCQCFEDVKWNNPLRAINSILQKRFYVLTYCRTTKHISKLSVAIKMNGQMTIIPCENYMENLEILQQSCRLKNFLALFLSSKSDQSSHRLSRRTRKEVEHCSLQAIAWLNVKATLGQQHTSAVYRNLS